MKISFCTTCKDRGHHLKKTLLRNIEDNVGQGVDVEFVVLDYNDTQGLKEQILGDPSLAPHLKSGTLKYARAPQVPKWNMAHAKNMSHRLATGDIVCNVDADNFLGRGFARHLTDAFSNDPDAIVLPSMPLLRATPNEEKGYCGRIAMSRENFTRLGGYDEQFTQWGGEDTDLSIRALAAGLRAAPFDNKEFIRVIPHSNEDRLSNTPLPLRHVAEKRLRESGGRISLGKLKDRFASVASLPQRNKGGHFGEGLIELGAEARPVHLGPVDRGPFILPHPVRASLQYLKMYRGESGKSEGAEKTSRSPDLSF